MRKIAFAFVIFVVPQCAPAQPAWENQLDRAERQFLRMRPSDARDLFLDVQRQAGQLPAGDLRRARLSVLLASTYADMGDHSRAIPLLEDSRRIWETAGIEDLRYLATLNLLASSLFNSNRPAEAWRAVENALSTGRRVLGQRHHIIGVLLTTAGTLHLLEGNVAKAQEALAGAVEVLRMEASPDPELATALRGLGGVHLLQGQMARARHFFTEAEVISRALGTETLYYAVALSNLGTFLVCDGDPARAQPLLMKALQIYDSMFGPDSGDAAPVLSGLAAVAAADRKFSLAAQYLDRALAVSRKAHGPESPQAAEVEYMTGWLLLQQGKPQEAQAPLEHANELFRRSYGEVHYKVADSFLLLGQTYDRQNRQSDAESAYRESIGGFERALGAKHAKVAEAMKYFAKTLKKTDKAEARLLERRSRSILASND